MPTEMERILGGTIGHDGKIPGTTVVPGIEVRFYSGKSGGKPKDQFHQITRASPVQHAKRGAANNKGCRVVAPDGSAFYGLSYHGDVDGWRQNIIDAARVMGLKLAWIDGQDFVVEDGRCFPVSECAYEFY